MIYHHDYDDHEVIYHHPRMRNLSKGATATSLASRSPVVGSVPAVGQGPLAWLVSTRMPMEG